MDRRDDHHDEDGDREMMIVMLVGMILIMIDDHEEEEIRNRGKGTSGGRVGHGGQTRLAYKVLSLKNTQIQTAQIHIPSITEKYPCE